MAYFHDNILDSGLSLLDTAGTVLHICSSEPTTFAGTTTASLGNSTINIPAPAARTPNGRKVVVPAVTGASVTASGTATHYAITDPTGSRLLVANTLSASQAVTTGNTWSTASFDVGIPGV
jgi:hypothetical protein